MLFLKSEMVNALKLVVSDSIRLGNFYCRRLSRAISDCPFANCPKANFGAILANILLSVAFWFLVNV